jgi:hypothetical protein
VLSFLGGFLILLEGALLLLVGSAIGSAGYVATGGTISLIGGFLGLLGLVVVLFAVGLYSRPEAHRGFGVVIVVLSFVSFVGGGGFVLGAVLGIIGGILAIVFDATYFEPSRPTEREPGHDRTCPSCGKIVSGDATGCPFCHAAV